MFPAIFAQYRYHLADPPKPMASLVRREFALQPRRAHFTVTQLPQLPDPNTPDNRIASNDFKIGPLTSAKRSSRQTSSAHQLAPASSNLLRRLAWPPRNPCVSENG